MCNTLYLCSTKTREVAPSKIEDIEGENTTTHPHPYIIIVPDAADIVCGANFSCGAPHAPHDNVAPHAPPENVACPVDQNCSTW